MMGYKTEKCGFNGALPQVVPHFPRDYIVYISAGVELAHLQSAQFKHDGGSQVSAPRSCPLTAPACRPKSMLRPRVSISGLGGMLA